MIRYYFLSIICSFFLTSSYANAAVKVVQCEDDEGNKSFHTNCPPGHKVVGEKSFKTALPSKGKTNPSNINALIYVTEKNCDSCQEVKEFLKVRNINITTIDASKDIEVQKELNDLAGSLTVPTTKIGDKVITGYKRNELQAALEAMGYEEPTE